MAITVFLHFKPGVRTGKHEETQASSLSSCLSFCHHICHYLFYLSQSVFYLSDICLSVRGLIRLSDVCCYMFVVYLCLRYCGDLLSSSSQWDRFMFLSRSTKAMFTAAESAMH